MHALFAKNQAIRNSNILHHGIVSLRQSMKPLGGGLTSMNTSAPWRAFSSTPTPPESPVLYKAHDNVFEILLNRPKALNSLDTNMCHLMLK